MREVVKEGERGERNVYTCTVMYRGKINGYANFWKMVSLCTIQVSGKQCNKK